MLYCSSLEFLEIYTGIFHCMQSAQRLCFVSFFTDDGDSRKLSTAAIIGICAASVFAILITLAAGVYWKKYHHRSRLRAAYYNDISMHDPLYEDFGPEVA